MAMSMFNNSMSQKQIQILTTMQRLWIEHSLWTRAFIISNINNLNNLDATTNRLLRNPVDFANQLRPLYGEQKAMGFQELLTDHLKIAANLVNAAKAGDEAEATKQRNLWYANADDIAKFLGEINPYWSAKKWQALLYDHLKMVENEALLELGGKYEESVNQYDTIQDQSLKMANYMANGIIRQFKI